MAILAGRIMGIARRPSVRRGLSVCRVRASNHGRIKTRSFGQNVGPRINFLALMYKNLL